MPDARVQLSITIETEGAEQLTSLRRELESLGAVGGEALVPLDASLAAVVNQLRDSREIVAGLQPIFRNFFQSLIGGARNFHDAVKRLLLDLLEFFLGIVRRMVEGWLSGLRLMSSFAPGLPGGFGGFGGFGISLGFPSAAMPGGGAPLAGGGPPLGSGGRFAAGGPGGVSVNIGPIVVQGAANPQATAEAVIREIRRRARDQGSRLPI